MFLRVSVRKHLLLVVLLLPGFAWSQAPLQEQRKVFLDAERWSYHPDSQNYRQAVAQLKNYPLLPYLQQRALLSTLSLKKEKDIAAFLDEHAFSPLEKPLRKQWLEYLAKRGDQNRFLDYYKDVNDDYLRCTYVYYRLAQGKHKEATYQLISELWLVGKSQHKACDPAFKQWTAAGQRSEEMVWQRLVLAADGGDHTLVPYLKSLLPAKQQYLGDLWLNARRNPASVSKLSQFPLKNPQREKQILVYALKRLVWRDDALALKTWQQSTNKFRFRDDEEQDVAHTFAIALASDNHPQAQFWLEKAIRHNADEELLRWHLTHVLRNNNWQQVVDVIEMAKPNLEADHSSQYWLARSYEQLKAPELASKHFNQLSDARHYYGFMASGKLAKDPNMKDHPVQASKELLDSVANLPAARRAKEFLALERLTEARREWMQMQSRLNQEQGLASAVLADSWGWHDQAIFTFGRLGYMDDVKRRFPLAFDQQLVGSAKKNHIDPAWAFAIARRESSFMVDANSSVGAKGLMQLMPDTAKYLAKRSVSNDILYDPGQNVEMGTRYLKYLMEKMHDNPVLATAAYNAGWGRVKKWLPKEDMPLDLWVETIPYKETRNYVKAVLAYKQIYKQRLGEDQNMFRDLATMQISADMVAK
ncbi:transglycosylase SLT domain-containing protein [Aliiglaciecola sp. CAU 1673]|uniref:transglycosylase SLT domain-containing protein n=1 Tax=Aliiglaciecola sp. CAU 1673 TaxID=3032595 RepID=UPI0023DA38E5|nr:transglycosylase SLT domain-containing protein [Aliiglaciecola sp. CAU 1673]MDF2179178.1 transglycosylase SLT domain-containing protein [Aliiglaciecola sp. CAU 1673]